MWFCPFHAQETWESQLPEGTLGISLLLDFLEDVVRGSHAPFCQTKEISNMIDLLEKQFQSVLV